MAGVDRTQVDGLQGLTVQTSVSEIGWDRQRGPPRKHFPSWLGLAPSQDISGGKTRRTGTKKTTHRAATAFRLAAQSLHSRDSALGGFDRRMRSKPWRPERDRGHGPQAGPPCLAPAHISRGLCRSWRRLLRSQVPGAHDPKSEASSAPTGPRPRARDCPTLRRITTASLRNTLGDVTTWAIAASSSLLVRPTYAVAHLAPPLQWSVPRTTFSFAHVTAG
jgi:Transposase IS116/IS110/IS902 family